MSWYVKAGEVGDGRSMTRAGQMLEIGRGAARDLPKANEWYRKAAEAGDALGMRFLAINLENGNGVAKDEPTALSYYLKAAEAGDAFSMLRSGIFFEQGRGSERSLTKANDWYKRAAVAGESEAMRRLAHNLTTGRGISNDTNEAIKWMRRAHQIDTARVIQNASITLGSDGANRPCATQAALSKQIDQFQVDTVWIIADDARLSYSRRVNAAGVDTDLLGFIGMMGLSFSLEGAKDIQDDLRTKRGFTATQARSALAKSQELYALKARDLALPVEQAMRVKTRESGDGLLYFTRASADTFCLSHALAELETFNSR